MAATVVGIYVRQAGVWERANGGTPTGFSGPQVRQAGVWKNCTTCWTRESAVWKPIWVNIDNEIAIGSYFATDFDISPYSVGADVRLFADGSADRFNNGSRVSASSWRPYDCGREYQYKVEEGTGYSSTYVTSEPTKNTWIDFTATLNFVVGDSGVGFLIWNTYWDVRIREKVSAPAAGNDIGDIHLRLEAEV